MDLILASQSPRRQDILKLFTDDFKVIKSHVDEDLDLEYPIEVGMMSVARAKALDVAGDNPESTVIAADTIVYKDGAVLGKPKDKAEAMEFLKDLSGTTHQVITSICIINLTEMISISDYVVTEILFDEIDDTTIEYYIKSGEWKDKAGGVGVQGLGSIFVKGIKGDYHNVVGLPINTVAYYLRNYFGINLMER